MYRNVDSGYYRWNSFQDRVYNMPFLLHSDGTPWYEANAFLADLVKHTSPMNRPTDEARRKASRLLKYKIFCEEEGIDWLDFAARRPIKRPTYRYFTHLLRSSNITSEVLNQHTGAVYSLYTFICENNIHDIDLDRVDSTNRLKLHFTSERGHFSKDVVKRSQTKSKRPIGLVEIGKVRDEGEDLRPLTKPELEEFQKVITGPDWSPLERLIYQAGLFTGARKQTVLTLRLKHIKQFIDENLQKDGTYPLRVGPGTGCDTKNDKKQILYFPKQLAEDLSLYINSPIAKKRRKKFLDRYEEEYPDLRPLSEDDMYVFLSDQGNCYYMGKNDPRYPIVKSRPIGQVSVELKKKLLKYSSNSFPKDFKHHWLRATFAYCYYLYLQEFIEKGLIVLGQEIGMIQHRLAHSHRETTENYLKLFRNESVRLEAQNNFEEYMLSGFVLEDMD